MSTVTKVDFHNVVSSEEAINIIEKTVKTIQNNPELATEIPSIIFRGAPGVGKSSIVREVANKLGIGFIDVRLAQMERCDLLGLPSVDYGTTIWNIPSIFPTDINSSGILFFDEITSAPKDCQVAAYSMILDRKIPNTNYELPPKWIIVAAGNRAIDKAVVQSMSSALANRFMHFELEPDSEQWTNWGIHHDISPSVIGYINYKPQNLFRMDNQNLEQGWPTPRSWEKVSNMQKIFGENEDIFRKVVYGLVGPGCGAEFIEFHKIAKKFDNVLEILTNPKKEFEIPEKADERYSFVSAAAYHIWRGETENDMTERVNGMYRIADKLTSDFATLLVKMAIEGNSKVSKMQALQTIMRNPNFKEFSKKFGKAFATKYTL